MTRRSLGFLTATAALAVYGGLHLEIASGRALDRLAPNDARLQTGATVATTMINRGAKSDRSAASPNTAERRTIVFQHAELPSTTVALRLWETAGAAKTRPTLKDGKVPASKPRQTVACEGMVSALTEVAKQLDPGRCVT
jgi:hypothetical protein